MLVDHLQSYAKCTECGEVIWCKTSEQHQACGCICGGIRLDESIIIGDTSDPDFTALNMEAILQAE